MIQVVDYENKDLRKIKNYDKKFLNTIKEKKIILIYVNRMVCLHIKHVLSRNDKLDTSQCIQSFCFNIC